MKFLIDMNLSLLGVTFLAERGYGASTGPQSVNRGRLIPRFLILRRRTTGSFSRTASILGCCWLHYGRARPSVIQVRAQDVLPAAIGDVVVRAIQTARSNLEGGALVTVEAYRHRVRVLPI